ncbi:IclR family transcriptional regulator [Pseudooceanicola aestuarii]|uniref:IclR family transcriptional regulator n=1 Tax=Pseudooceanicola aestuarii TaxID=2697319 RepID=UPI0013D1A6B7|nr:IclR family transcriptional regulator [Pseudooceanicola aestuarii]
MALTILEKIAFSDEAMSQTEIAAAMGIVKSAAHKHLHTLEESGWLIRDHRSHRYGIGPKAWLIGQRATWIDDLTQAADSRMRETRNQTGLAVVLSSVNKRSVTVIAALHGTHEIEIGVRQGSRLEVHASAQGQVMLAFGDPKLAEDVCAEPMQALTPRTLTDPGALRRRITEVRQQGYAVAPQETLLGVNVIAAPVFGHDDRLIATVAMIGSIQHLAETPDPALVTAILELARSISQTRGHRGAGGG